LSHFTPVFIVGAPRSGTTLARDLISFLDQIYFPPDELQVISPLNQLILDGASPNLLVEFLEGSNFSSHMKRRKLWPSRTDLLDIVTAKSTSEVIRGLILKIGSIDGSVSTRYWGDKTPENIFLLDLIRQLWPDVKIIHIIRDPRSTVLSMKKSWGRSFVRGASLWRDAVVSASATADSISSESFYKLRYEDLTANPDRELSAIAEWLGVNFDSSRLDTYKSEERWGEASGQQGVKSNPRGWENRLTKKQILTIEEVTYDAMVLEGYTPRYAVKSSRPSKFKIKFLFLLDGLSVLAHYTRERGFRAAFEYKLKQWRLGRGG
jgi:hypothetical protein